EDPVEEKPSGSQPFAWEILLQDMNIVSGSMDFVPLGSAPSIPGKIRDLNCELSLTFDDEGLSAVMEDFRVETISPNITVTEISFWMSLQNNNLTVRNLELTTAKSQILGELFMDFSNNSEYMIKLSSSDVSLDEASNFVPDLQMKGIAHINGLFKYAADDISTDIEIQHRDQEIILIGFLKDMNSYPSYDIQGDITAFQPDYWFRDQNMDSKITGQFKIKGKGLQPDSSKGSLRASFNNSRIYGKHLDSLIVSSVYDFGNITGKVLLKSEAGVVDLNANMDKLANSSRFDIRGTIHHLNLAGIIAGDREPTDINLRLTAKGNGLSLPDLSGYANLYVSTSTLYNTSIDTLYSSFDFDDEKLLIDTLYAMNPVGNIQLSGQFAFNRDLNLDVLAHINELSHLEPMIDKEGINGKGWVRGHFYGTPDSLNIDGHTLLHSLKYNKILVDSIRANYGTLIQKSSVNGEVNAQVKKIKTGQINLDSLTVDSKFRPDSIHARAGIYQTKNIHALLEASTTLDSIIRVFVPDLEINIFDRQWRNENPNLTVVIYPDEFQFKNLSLVSEDQSISISGMFSTSGEEDLSVNITGLNFGFLSEFATFPNRLQGILDLNANVTGVASAPVVDGNIKIYDGLFNNYSYDSLALALNYKDELLEWQMKFLPTENSQLRSEGHLPINLALTKNMGAIDSTRNVLIKVNADTIDFAVIQAISNQFRDVSGRIAMDLKIHNTLNNLYPTGSISLNEGSLEVPAYGIQYNDMKLAIDVSRQQIKIDNFVAKRDDGVLTLSGTADVDHNRPSQLIRAIDLELEADKFLVMSNDNYEAVIDGNLILTGSESSPKFDGLVRILRSRFYIPALTEAGGTQVREIKPLLVRASEDTTAEVQSVKTSLDTMETLSLMDNLTGSARIEIPRNTWLRSPDMNVELSGELVLVKQGEQFELFGSINVRRGTYKLYGKRFQIEKGVFNFQGGREFNPQIDLIAEHVFRTPEREKQTLKLHVTGTAQSPELNFTLDDREITEGDALSYILFGKNIERLTHGQKSDLDQQSGFDAKNTANNLVVGFIAGQLSQTLGETLELDMIDLKSEENWQYATFIVGKYLTNDLFLSYKRQFGETETNEIVPDEITLEYEVTPRLFLQLIQGSEKTSGFDVIIKLER
ncbi:hypothetical protein GF337_20675, partial [candidate division KSB1 bacterium]|nr:hypothetical protein [candidate division KSB1 bacterium]